MRVRRAHAGRLVAAIEHRERWDDARPLLPWLLGILLRVQRAERRRRAFARDRAAPADLDAVVALVRELQVWEAQYFDRMTPPEEIGASYVERVLADTASDGLQLCIDTGHFAYAGIDPVRFFIDHRARTPYLHFKDINPIVHQKVIGDGVAFFDAVSMGVFCPVGQGVVDFAALANAIQDFDGSGTIEQDRDFRSTTTALEDAKASLDYLRGIGLAD